MNFSFRPLVSYAAHTKKRCFDLVRRIRDRGINEVFDGFLLHAVRQRDLAIGYAIDLPGDIFCAGFQSVYSTGFSFATQMGYRIVSVEGEPFAGNMTWSLVAKDSPAYTSAFGIRLVGPSGYVSTSGKEWGAAFGVTVMLDQPIADKQLTYCTVSTGGGYGPDNPFADIHIFRIKPSPAVASALTSTSPLTGDTPLTPGACRIIHTPVASTGVDAEHQFGEAAISSFYSASVGYIVYFGKEYNEIYGGYNDPNPQIGIARIDIRAAEGEEESCVATTTPLAVFTQDDILLPDVAQNFDWPHPGPFDGAYTFLRLNGDYNTEFPNSYFYRPTFPEPGDSYSWHGYTMFEGLQKTDASPVDYLSVWAEQPSCVAHAGGIDILFTFVTEREPGFVSATFLYSSIGGVPAPYEITMDVPESLSRYNHTATYLLRVGNDGGKQIHAIERLTYSIHNPETRDVGRAVYAPLFSFLEVIEEVERTVFVCLRSATSPGVMAGAGGGWFRGVATQVGDVSLRIIDGDGNNIAADIGDNYPVFYPAQYAVPTPDAKAGYTYSKPDCRYGYGSYSARSTNDKVVRPSPVCMYAQGMIAVIVAPNAGFLNEEQIAKLVVVRTSDGSFVAESEFEMPFVVRQLSDSYDLTQWSVSCIEQGALDEDGVLTKHAKLLISEVTKGNPSTMYVADDLETLRLVGVWGNIGSDYIRGPLYYIGSPVAPAIVGKTTLRSFLGGAPVA